MKSKKKSKLLADWGVGLIVVAIIIALVAVVASILTGSTVNTSEEKISESTTSLSCESKSPTDGFFDLEGVVKAEHEVKVLFDSNDKIKEMMYTLDAKYPKDTKLNVEQAKYSVKYDTFMDEHSLDRDAVAADFGRTDESVKVKLHIEAKRLNNMTAKLFFLTSDDYANLGGQKGEKLMKAYQGKGFSCKYKD